MTNNKICVLGANEYINQVPRIKEGLKELGYVISQESQDMIYANNPRGYQPALVLNKKNPNAYLIFNFLDIPWHHSNIEKQTELLVKHFLLKADAVTVISYKIKADLSKFLNKKIEVIYNPAKDVCYDENIKKDNMFLYVGRANDPVKRIRLVRDSLKKIGDELKNIKICGMENPGFGNYLNVVSDGELNRLYNSSKYVLLPSKNEGIGLSMIEGMICGAIPITCSDNLTAKEFSPPDFICEPNTQSIISKIQELEKDYKEKNKLALEFGKKYQIQFTKKTIAKNIVNIFNIGRKNKYQ